MAIVFRYFVTCCAADAQPIGLVIKKDNGLKIKNNDWVRITGVVMVMLFAISLNMTWLGILIGIFISIGMAVTVSGVVVLGVSGKSAVLLVTSCHKKIFFIIEAIIEIMAGLMIMGLGVYFSITTA